MPPRDEQGRWLKGTSPNPGGRPKGRGLQAEIEHQLLECPVGSHETRMERIARVLLDMCEAGDTRARELLLKRVWPERLSVDADAGPVVVIRDYTGRTPKEDADSAGPAPTPLLESGLEPEPAKPTTCAIRRSDEDEREAEAPL